MTPSPQLAALEDVVRDVAEEHDVDEDALRARVADLLATGLRASGVDPDPEIEAEASRHWLVN